MLDYEISRVVHVLIPYIAPTLSVVVGIIISNMFWKARIYRYANATILKTLEYQANKIEQLEEKIRDNNSLISDQKGSLKIVKTAALKIIGEIR